MDAIFPALKHWAILALRGGCSPFLPAPLFPLRLLGGAVLFLEEGVGVLRAVEGRVEIDEVHGLAGDVAGEDVQVVAVVEGAHVRVGVADGRALGEGL